MEDYGIFNFLLLLQPQWHNEMTEGIETWDLEKCRMLAVGDMDLNVPTRKAAEEIQKVA